MALVKTWDPALELQVREYAAVLGLDEEAVQMALSFSASPADVYADPLTIAVNRMLSWQRHPSNQRRLTVV